MEREHLIIIAIVLVVMWMLMGHSSDCNCEECMNKAMMPSHIRYKDPINDTFPGGHIRMSDKYFGATQHIQHHLRRDNKRGLLNGLYAGAPQHIRYGGDCPDPNMPC